MRDLAGANAGRQGTVVGTRQVPYDGYTRTNEQGVVWQGYSAPTVSMSASIHEPGADHESAKSFKEQIDRRG